MHNTFFHLGLLLALLSITSIHAQEAVQLDTLECIRKKGKVKQLYYREATESHRAPTREPDFTLFLFGDTGNPHCVKPLNSYFYTDLKKQNSESAILFLGDNVYPNGIPYKSGKKKEIAEAKLEVHLSELVDYPYQAYFVAGNHDYHKVFKSPKRIIAQQELISSYNQKSKGDIAYSPINQEGRLVEFIELSERIGLITIDSEWAIKKINKNMIQSAFREPLRKALEESKNYEYLIIAAHHPLYTVGDHGHEKLFIASEDLHRKKYRKFIGEIEPHLPAGVKIIYAAGHDHSIQHIKLDRFSQIVSGSGSKSNHVIQDNITSDSLKLALENRLADSKLMGKRDRFKVALQNLKFATNYQGYVQLDFYHSGAEVWMNVLVLDDDVKQVYANRLF